jgi:three-Cys-motif partner protein
MSEAEELGGLLFELPAPTVPDSEIVVKAPTLPLWTAAKARLISRYIYYFEYVTHHGTYIDGFAGPQSPDLPESWAAEMVLGLEPLWLRHFHLCDAEKPQFAALRALKSRHSGKDITIYRGDFNKKVDEIIRPGILKKEATFCLLDQRTFECTWATVEKLARSKAPEEGGTKIELFYFLAQSWLDRAFSGLGPDGRRLAEAWWGGPEWPQLMQMSAWDRARTFCERFKKDLGYKSVKPWAIYASEADRHSRLMFHMIHATDHPEAPKLMARAYEWATNGPTQGAQLSWFPSE